VASLLNIALFFIVYLFNIVYLAIVIAFKTMVVLFTLLYSSKYYRASFNAIRGIITLFLTLVSIKSGVISLIIIKLRVLEFLLGKLLVINLNGPANIVD
jgi:hypothetical protein